MKLLKHVLMRLKISLFLFNKKIAKLNGESEKLCSNGDPEANYLGSSGNSSAKNGGGKNDQKPRDRAASLISISATPSYERNFLLAVKVGW